MRLLAAAAAGFVAYALMGWLLGYPVTVDWPRRRGQPRRTRQRRWLRQAGASVDPAGFAALSAAAGAAGFAAAYAVSGAAAVAAPPALLGAFAPYWHYSRRRRRRLAEVRAAWPDGVRDLAASVEQGLPIHHAVAELARSGPPPLRRAFAGYPANARALGVVPALAYVREELADPTSDRVLEVLILAAERGSGGDLLTRLLTDLADTITRDLRTAEDIETARLEPRLDMLVTAAIPWLLLVAMVAMQGPHRAYYSSAQGAWVVAVGAALTAAGVAVMRLLCRDPVETRVLAGDREHRR